MAEQLIYFGKLSLLYDNGFVRYIRAGETEIVRSIYFALRDNNWTTAPFERMDERISVTPKNFEISYTATNIIHRKEVFRWHVRIAGNESGEVEFTVDGECLASYNRNRAGICVLHPIRDTRDRDVQITRPDGTLYKSVFPSAINPHQPFFDIQKMNWPLVGDAWAELQFEGDTFETEDQRNWSDASFKTYSTPLSKPYPVMLKPGDKVSQRVKLSLVNGDSLPAADLAEDIEVTIDENSSKKFPAIGTDFSYESGDVSYEENLIFDHLRIELDSSDWKDKLPAGLKKAKEIGAKPFVHLVLNSPEEFDEIKLPPNILLAVSPVDRKTDIDRLLQPISKKAKIGAGFTSHFTELNRNRFDYSKVEFVTYPVTPQAHLSDIHTVVENLSAQKDQVETGKSFTGGKKIHVGPVSLKVQSTELAAGWMLGSIKYLTEGGADFITMFASNCYDSYTYAVLLSLKNLNPETIISSTCNEPLIITSLVIESGKSRHLILINHTSLKKSVTASNKLYTLSPYEIIFTQLR